MVRINLIHPKKLADQHLIAEYLEIMMLVGYTKKYPSGEDIPENYRLGKGHIKFFKNKLKYLKNRHKKIKKEMRNRSFKANKELKFKYLSNDLMNDWKPKQRDFKIIKERILSKIKSKPDWYRYYGVKQDFNFFKKIINY